MRLLPTLNTKPCRLTTFCGHKSSKVLVCIIWIIAAYTSHTKLCSTVTGFVCDQVYCKCLFLLTHSAILSLNLRSGITCVVMHEELQQLSSRHRQDAPNNSCCRTPHDTCCWHNHLTIYKRCSCCQQIHPMYLLYSFCVFIALRLDIPLDYFDTCLLVHIHCTEC